MCGIAGFIGKGALPADRVSACLSRMRRRGPDAAASQTWSTPNGNVVQLLHSRLSIIDLDARANQPLRSGPEWIVLNGEIYNYLEIRKTLEGLGRTFKTSGDTEVLLQALAEWGPMGALDRAEGMWAFATYNEDDGSLILCRDRFGEKPLFLFEDETGLYFGSEPKFIIALLGRPLKPNLQHVRRFLVNGYKSLFKTGETFFQGLRELPSATFLTIADGRKSETEYWQPSYAPDEEMTYEQAVAGVRERLIRAVKIRLRADVPLAFCMSGGVDSNSIISIAKKVLGQDAHGFTIVNKDSRYEEQDMVHHAVQDLQMRHTEILVNTRDFLPRLRKLVNYHDSPVATVSSFAHWLLIESIADQGYKISIRGTAADEIFTGYYDHHLAYLHEVSANAEVHQESRNAWMTFIRPLARNPFLQDPDRFVRDPAFRDHIYLDADKFAGYLTTGFNEPFEEERFADDLLRNRMMNEMFRETVPVLLHEDDRNNMFYSVENRSPFLDRELFEFAYRIPSRFLIRDGRAKAILRDAMAGILTEPVRTNRRKVGFNAPIYDFLDRKDPAVRGELMRASPIFDVVRKDRIEELLDRPEVTEAESKFLFSFISAKMFLEEFA